MPKTYKNLFSKIIIEKNLLIALRGASAQKRFSNTVLNFEENLAENILELLKNLKNKTYKHGEYRHFRLFDPKEREISAAPFRDRVIHHAISQIMEPIFDKKFIYDSFACRKTKGSHKAIERLQTFLIKNSGIKPFSVYVLQCDVSKCFPSVNHEILLKILSKKIKDKNIMRLLKKVISSYESDDRYNKLFPPDSHFRTKRPRGIPIGNLTSQLFVNIYLNELDQYLKHQLKIKYYVRYVDDFIILAKNKKYLRELAEKIRTFLYAQLYLTLHPKKMRIFPSRLGIDFLGYLIFKDHIRLRASNVKAFRKRLRKFQKLYSTGKISQQKIRQSITSWLAHAEHADTYNLRKAIFGLRPDGDPEGKPLGAKNQKEITEFIHSWKPALTRQGKRSSEKPIHKPSGQLRLF